MSGLRRTLLVLAMLVVTACSGGGGATTELALVSDDISFDTTELEAPAGTVTIVYSNNDEDVAHNLQVSGDGVEESTEVTAGPVEQTLTLTLEPGTYEFLCTVHPEEMQGTLTVTE